MNDDGAGRHSDLDELLGIGTTSEGHAFRPVLSRSPASSLHASATGVQRHRPSDMVEAAPARVARVS